MMQHNLSVVEQAAGRSLSTTFEPLTLADDLLTVQHLYADLFATVDTSRWDWPAERGREEWTLHETIAHLCALNGAGLDGVMDTLRGELYTFRGLENRYRFNAYNRQGIEEHLGLSPDALCAEFIRIHDEASAIARTLLPGQAELTLPTPIYNRPIQIVEALSIMVMHAGLIHTAQVAEPAGLSPLWLHLSPEFRHRMIERVMRAFSLLYRPDIGGSLRATLVFRVDGPGGGAWHVDLTPEGVSSGDGGAAFPSLILRFHTTDDFCRMLTGRMNLPLALLAGKLKLRGDLRLFPRMSRLFSIDARP